VDRHRSGRRSIQIERNGSTVAMFDVTSEDGVRKRALVDCQEALGEADIRVLERERSLSSCSCIARCLRTRANPGIGGAAKAQPQNNRHSEDRGTRLTTILVR
jgi:hypothetical protein